MSSLVSLALVACADDSSGADAETSTSTTSTTSATTNSSSSSSDSDEAEAESSEGDTDDATSLGFVPETDEPNCEGSFCDVFATSPIGAQQGCPDGEKCVPFVYEPCGGMAACRPVYGELGAGADCQSNFSDDDCDAYSWCYPAWLGVEGPSTCVPYCDGTADDPTCADPGRRCAKDPLYHPDGGLIGCFLTCDPLQPTACSPEQRCTLGSQDAPDFVCLTGGGVPDEAACTFDQECDAGLCLPAEAFASCQGEACCARWCDVQAPDCPMGRECVLVEVEAPDSQAGVCQLAGP